MYKKIDVYYNGAYLHSTNSCKTCKEAVKSVKDYLLHNTDPRIFSYRNTLIKKMGIKDLSEFQENKLKAFFDHSRR